MCLTGVDYFSSLGYAPGISYLAATILAPLATLILVLLTLFGALPVYSRVAKVSPHGQGSIAMLENLLPGWQGKTLVLILLGFAATDFIITITLSAADATAHIIENPFVPTFFQNKLTLTLCLLVILGGIFLKGFKEAIGIALLLVTSFLSLNAVIVMYGLGILFQHPELFAHWQQKLLISYHSIWTMLGISALLFPKLALGMSGFETGVAVMPLIEGDENDTEENPQGRIRRSRYLLLTAALIMSVFLLGSSLTTTILIPPHEFYEGGKANGRALAYLAHHLLGNTFGTIYDISTISILWFAGASAMAGLLNLVPRYLPRYGMAPHWASAIKPLVIFFTLITLYVTLIFKADVDAQAGAYATGVLVLFTSASLAVTLLTFKAKEPVWLYYLMATIIFTYTAIQNMIQRPEGLHIASFFIFTIIAVSIISRSIRSTELRIKKVTFDHLSIKAIEQAAAKGSIRLLAHNTDSETSYRNKEAEARSAHNIEHSEGDFIFLEISLSDTSEFIDNCLEVNCRVVKEQHLGQTFEYYVLTCTALAIPNAIAAILLEIKSMTKVIPNAYFGWTEGHPIACFVKYIFLGEGETATITREILRSKESDPKLRPRIHVA